MDNLIISQINLNSIMILQDELSKIVISQRENIGKRDRGTLREGLQKVRPLKNFAIVISGIRRCGKSTLLVQSMDTVKNFNYLNFEDPRLTEFELRDFELLEDIFSRLSGDCDIYYFDEIQNLTGFESYVRYLLDKGKKVIITGSNASLLSKELGARLTGRNLRIELFPFSYKEFLDYYGYKDSDEKFEEFLFSGGFPEYLRTGMDEVLQNLLMDIIARDIIYRYNIKNSGLITEIAVYLLGNISKEFTLSKLRKIFSSIGSVTTIASYVNYLEDSYIIFTLPRFSYSLKSRQINPKKIYAVDNGFIKANSTGFSEDYGRLLENYVFIELRKKYRELYYFREKGECDFLIKEKTKITKAIQVCYKVDNRNKDREINGLLEAIDRFNLKEGFILTFNQKDEITIDSRRIKLVPARDFFS